LNGEFSVTDELLSQRREWRLTKSIDEVPEFLGDPPSDPPPVELLPLKIQPTIRAFGLVMGNVFDEPKEATEKISGLAVSPGIYEGTAKVILSTRDFDRLEKGDILVTKNTSAGFNVVLPIIGALVTDRGGILSHAAIVSREFGIPGVVGTKSASQLIKDGDKIRVNGDTGEVEIL
jgi:pyruvate,water dikinase